MKDTLLMILCMIGMVCLVLLLCLIGWYVIGVAVLFLNDHLLHWSIDMDLFHTLWLVVLGSAFIFACSHIHKDDE